MPGTRAMSSTPPSRASLSHIERTADEPRENVSIILILLKPDPPSILFLTCLLS